MKLIHIGYRRKDARAVLDGLLSNSEYFLIDIRISTSSLKRPEWSYDALRKRYGTQYLWLQSLGNANRFKGNAEMALLNKEKGIDALRIMLQQGLTPILLCACEKYTECHRQLVVAEILKEFPDLQVVEPDKSGPKKVQI